MAQRQALRQKGDNPDVLAMTATPIPRTLAITSYGEMDISVIDELPAGRKPVTTRWIKSAQIDSAVQFVLRELAAGHQAYVVTPLIEESEAVDMKNAEAIYERFFRLFFTASLSGWPVAWSDEKRWKRRSYASVQE